LQSIVEQAIKELGEKKAARDNDVPGDGLKLLGEDDFRIMTQLIKKIYKNGKRPKDFTEVTVIALTL